MKSETRNLMDEIDHEQSKIRKIEIQLQDLDKKKDSTLIEELNNEKEKLEYRVLRYQSELNDLRTKDASNCAS